MRHRKEKAVPMLPKEEVKDRLQKVLRRIELLEAEIKLEEARKSRKGV